MSQLTLSTYRHQNKNPTWDDNIIEMLMTENMIVQTVHIPCRG
uniref:Uncharacterized protein n=1 Tax=Arundo donax TaxID=35708 RepID=A0A0A8YKF8_ARUDO